MDNHSLDILHRLIDRGYRIARRAGVDGAVELIATDPRTGRELGVLSPDGDLDAAALELQNMIEETDSPRPDDA